MVVVEVTDLLAEVVQVPTRRFNVRNWSSNLKLDSLKITININPCSEREAASACAHFFQRNKNHNENKDF